MNAKLAIITPKERGNLDLLELVCQLHSRALNFPSEEMHKNYIEARMELESRLSPASPCPAALQPTAIEEYFTKSGKRLNDEFGWTGEFNLTAKDVLDFVQEYASLNQDGQDESFEFKDRLRVAYNKFRDSSHVDFIDYLFGNYIVIEKKSQNSNP